MADDLWVRCPIAAPFRPWICTRCGASLVEAEPIRGLAGLTPREVHAAWHARQDGVR